MIYVPSDSPGAPGTGGPGGDLELKGVLTAQKTVQLQVCSLSECQCPACLLHTCTTASINSERRCWESVNHERQTSPSQSPRASLLKARLARQAKIVLAFLGLSTASRKQATLRVSVR